MGLVVSDHVSHPEPVLTRYGRPVSNNKLGFHALLPSINSDEERNKIVEQNLRIISYRLRPVFGSNFNDPDLYQYACLGLLRAAELYNPALGYKFVTYATYYVASYAMRGMIENFDFIRKPNWVWVEWRKLLRARRRLREEIGQDLNPSDELIILESGESRIKFDFLKRHMFQEVVGEGPYLDPEFVGTSARDLNQPVINVQLEAWIELESVCNEINEVIRYLKEFSSKDAWQKNVEIFRLTYGLTKRDVFRPPTLEKTGQFYHVTKERIRQVRLYVFKKISLQFPARGRTWLECKIRTAIALYELSDLTEQEAGELLCD